MFGAQLGLALLVGVGKGALVAQISTLPRGSRDPDVGLHLLLAVHRGLDHRGLVNIVGGDAFSLEWALASQPRRPWAVAAPLLLLRNSCGQHLLVVLGHHLLDVGAGSIADLQGLAVEDFAHQGALGEALVDQGQELGADVGVDVDRVGRVPPDDVPCPLPPGCSAGRLSSLEASLGRCFTFYKTSGGNVFFSKHR